ncbi:unnamed protein product [Rotaria magnacalcarata]
MGFGSTFKYLLICLCILIFGSLTISPIYSYHKARALGKSYYKTQCKVLQISVYMANCTKIIGKGIKTYECLKENATVEYTTEEEDVNNGFISSIDGHLNASFSRTPIGTISTCYYRPHVNGILKWIRPRATQECIVMIIRLITIGPFTVCSIIYFIYTVVSSMS